MVFWVPQFTNKTAFWAAMTQLSCCQPLGLLVPLVPALLAFFLAKRKRAALGAKAQPIARGRALKDLTKPMILQGLDIGQCLERWTDEYLKEKLKETKIQVHVSENPFLNFDQKNFSYEILRFDEFLDRSQAARNSFLYYRSQHSNRKKAASLESLALGQDFELPADLMKHFSEVHSSVLRIASSGLCMWLHYDVCDNFLCCIRGRKRVVLFHPDDIGHLYISASSSALGSRLLGPDLDALWRDFPLAEAAWHRRFEVTMSAGDVLFLPAFWPHCTQALPHAEPLSISVNSFMLPTEVALHDPKDVWANRELLPAQDAIKALEDKVLPSLAKLPDVPRSFYCKKLAARLERLSLPTT